MLTAKPDLCLPHELTNPVVSVIPVDYGCLGSCAYCCVLFARGHLRSYSLADVTKRFKNDLARAAREAYRNDKVFKFLHLPVQSGDDEILARMHRFYTVQQFKEIVEAFRTAFREVTLATYVICGFPARALEKTRKLSDAHFN